MKKILLATTTAALLSGFAGSLMLQDIPYNAQRAGSSHTHERQWLDRW